MGKGALLKEPVSDLMELIRVFLIEGASDLPVLVLSLIAAA